MTIDRAAAAYDTVSQTYEDRFVDELGGKPRDRELLDGFAAESHRLVVDLGCGPGHIGRYVQEHGPRVIGVDVSHRMAVRAAGRLTGAVVADMRSLPFHDGAVSGVVAFYSVIHLPRGDISVAFDEFARVLERGGRILLSAHEGDGDVEVHDFLGHEVDLAASFFRLHELEDAATAAGLTMVRRERRPPYDNEGSTVRLYIEAVKQGS